MKKSIAALAMAAVCSIANAQFQARDLTGDGIADAVYDVAHNLTWLTDANYVATVGTPIQPDPYFVGIPDHNLPLGGLSFTSARTFVDNLVVGSVSDWRLPGRIIPEAWPNQDILPIQYLFGTPNTYATSELSFIAGALDLFTNVQTGRYLTYDSRFQYQAYVAMPTGTMRVTDETSLLSGYVIAVRDGDAGTAVTPVPEPSAWALMLAGLAGVGAYSRRRAARAN